MLTLTVRCQAKLLAAPRDELLAVLNDAFLKQARHQADRASRNPDELGAQLEHVVDELSLDQRLLFSQNMSLWCKGAAEAINSPAFWVVMCIRHRVGVPLERFRRFLQKHEVLKKSTSAGSLAHLVWGKASEYLQMFDSLMDDAPWQDILSGWPAEQGRQSLMGLIQWMVAACAADFQRRIVARLAEYPFCLLWLAKEEPTKVCHRRKAVAVDLLSRDDLDPNARKLRQLFEAQLQETSETGLLDRTLWTHVRALAMMWRCGTEEIESINSLIKLNVKLAPNISLPLLSARCAICKACGLGSRSSTRKWSVLQPVVKQVRNAATNFASEAAAIMGQTARWAPICTQACLREHAPLPLTQGVNLTEDELRAAGLSLQWSRGWTKLKKDRRCKVIPLDVCFTFEGLGGKAWLCAATYNRLGLFLECAVCHAEGQGPTLTLKRPLAFATSVDVFKQVSGAPAPVGVKRWSIEWTAFGTAAMSGASDALLAFPAQRRVARYSACCELQSTRREVQATPYLQRGRV